MKNLFVMHTQYNLILSAGVVSKLPDSHNTLVVYAEFSVSKEILDSLNKVFDRVVVVRDHFEPSFSVHKECKVAKRWLKKTECFWAEEFDCVYFSQERLFDMCLLSKLKAKNPSIKCYSVEEDVYYSINNRFNVDEYTHRIGFKQRLKNRLARMLMFPYSCKYLEDIYCYAMNSAIGGVHIMFPDLARREIAKKELIEISSQELLAGIDAIYGDKQTVYPCADKYAIMFFDLMSRYKNKELVSQISLEFIKKCEEKGIQVLIKYHPRETEKFDIDGACEIDQLIPAEKILADLYDKDAVVFGNATTSCIVAAKLGYKVVSIAKIESEENKKMHEIMKKMNIECIENISDMEEILK